MKYRFMGETGVRVSELCLGTMPFGGSADERESALMFQTAREAGINFFDTANVYNQGRSEEILGSLIQECRDQVVVATKAYFPIGEGPNDRGASRYHLVRAVEESLRRLKTDRIDLFYLHRFDECTAMEASLRALEDLVRSGKVLYLGASNFAAWQVSRALGKSELRGWSKFAAIQPMYNLVKRQAEVELLPMANAESLGVFPYSPLGGGLLSGKYGLQKRPREGRLVENRMYQTRYGEEHYYRVAEDFTALAAEAEVHPVSLAVAWVGAHRAVTAPIVGAKTVEQLRPALKSVEVEMEGELYDRIAALSPAPPPATDRNEERSAFNYGSR